MDKPQIVGNTITVPSSQDFLPDVDVFIEGILRGYGIDESVIADIAISVSELVNNAIFHGNKSRSQQPITVQINRENSSVKISVKDRGHGFSLDDIDNPIDDSNLLKEVGRGLFIVKSLMDSVDLESDDSGSTVVITKKIK